MGVRKDWESKNRVHTQFFTSNNPGYGVPQYCETKPCSLPPVPYWLSCPAFFKKCGIFVILDVPADFVKARADLPPHQCIGGWIYF